MKRLGWRGAGGGLPPHRCLCSVRVQLHWVSTIKEHLGDIMAVIRVQSAFRTYKARAWLLVWWGTGTDRVWWRCMRVLTRLCRHVHPCSGVTRAGKELRRLINQRKLAVKRLMATRRQSILAVGGIGASILMEGPLKKKNTRSLSRLLVRRLACRIAASSVWSPSSDAGVCHRSPSSALATSC